MECDYSFVEYSLSVAGILMAFAILFELWQRYAKGFLKGLIRKWSDK